MFVSKLARRYMAPEGEGAAGGGSVDRGDVVDAPVVEPVVEEVVEPVVEPVVEAPRDEKGQYAKKDDEHYIPKAAFDARVDKEVAKREAAERRADALEAQIKQVDRGVTREALEAGLSELEEKLEAARMDGNKDQALALSKQLRLAERQIAVEESTRMSNAAKDGAREEMRLELTIEKMETTYDALNENHEDFDQDLVDMVLASQSDLIRREGMAPSKALETAAKKVMGRLAPAPKAADTKDTGLGKAKETAGDRKTDQVKSNVAAAKGQPASTKDVGMDADKAGIKAGLADASQLSVEEYAALPESTRAKMRGDYL